MNIRLRAPVLLTASLLATLLQVLQTGCQRHQPEVVIQPPATVSVAVPVEKEVTEFVEFTGQTKAVSSVAVRARVSGYLKDVAFEEGSEVKEGALLYQIDPVPFEAELEKAKAELSRSEAQLIKATADLSRSNKLRMSNAISQEDYDTSVALEAISRAAVASAKGAVKLAQENLGYTKIIAPISGRVSRTSITEGNVVYSSALESAVLTTIVSLDPMYVDFTVDERTILRHQEYIRQTEGADEIKDIKQRKIPAYVGLANEASFPHQGMLEFVDNQIDPQTGTIAARAVLDNSKRHFTSGMFARVRLPFGKPFQALLIPTRAIFIDQGERCVYVVDEKEMVQRRAVKLGFEEGRERVVESGLVKGDRVIVEGILRVRTGDRVVVQALATAAEKLSTAPGFPTEPATAGND